MNEELGTIAGEIRWMQEAQDWLSWHLLGEAYVQQRMMMKVLCFLFVPIVTTHKWRTICSDEDFRTVLTWIVLWCNTKDGLASCPACPNTCTTEDLIVLVEFWTTIVYAIDTIRRIRVFSQKKNYSRKTKIFKQKIKRKIK